MQTFQHETVEVDVRSDVAPARVHPGDHAYVLVPVRWRRGDRRWMESPGYVIRLPDGGWLVGFSMGHLFGDMLPLRPTDMAGMGNVCPILTEVVGNSTRGAFGSPCLHRVADPDTFCAPPSEATFIGMVMRRQEGTRADEFGVLVMEKLCGLVDVCLALQLELAACPSPLTVRRSHRLVPRPRRRKNAPDPHLGEIQRLEDVTRQLSLNSRPPSPTGAG